MSDDLFKVGDVISIGNADRPAWVAGYWRVQRVEQKADGWHVKLLPLQADAKTVDEERAGQREYWIEPGGLTVCPTPSPSNPAA